MTTTSPGSMAAVGVPAIEPAYPIQYLHPASPEALEAVAEVVAHRLLEKAEVTSFTSCWRWRGAVNKEGYGLLRVDGRHRPAHRLAYVVARGPIADWLAVDHLCKNTACINPLHLEAVTHGLNIKRALADHGGAPASVSRLYRAHCKWGHPFDEANTRVKRDGTRECKTCARRWKRSRHA